MNMNEENKSEVNIKPKGNSAIREAWSQNIAERIVGFNKLKKSTL